jgi:ribosomal protein S18 acetylase RimI-like enzyme
MNAARDATAADLPTLVELMSEFYAEAGYALDEEWAKASFSALLEDDALGRVWMILCDSQPAGYVVLTVRFAMEYGGLDGYIDDLFIRPGFRGRRLGRAALDALVAECGRRGVLALHVEVGRDNEVAQTLYRSYGLKPYGDDRQVLVGRLDCGVGET